MRDALLGQVPRELDFVVEGDAAAVARRAAARLGGRVVVHERFGTATVRGAGTAFDLASARRETYPRPGAPPSSRSRTAPPTSHTPVSPSSAASTGAAASSLAKRSKTPEVTPVT